MTVHEAGDTIGGGCRTAELTLPGFRHDVCAAILPLARRSPAFAGLDVEWIDPPVPAAHALDGDAVTLERRIAGDGRRPRRRRAELPRARRAVRARVAEALVALGPAAPAAVARPRAAQRARDRAALRRPSAAGRCSPATRRIRPCRSSARRRAGFGLALCAAAHVDGWPFPRGGSQALVDALAARLSRARRRDRDVQPRRRVAARRRRPLRRRAARARTHRAPAAATRSGSVTAPAAFKLDWALDGPIPWTSDALPPRRRPSTSAARSPRSRSPSARRGRDAARRAAVRAPRAARASSTTRARRTGKHTAWAYCHVPQRLGRRRDRRDRGAGRALRAGLPRR